MRRSVVLMIAASLVARSAGAQRIETVRAGVAGVANPAPATGRLQPYAALLSVVAPGTGQLALGKDDAVLFGAVEVLMWLKVVKDVGEQRTATNEFVAIARDIARANFAQRDTSDWLYYEHMRNYLESGAYDKATGNVFTPETDVTTYNGTKWMIAQRNHADHEGALAEYRETAIKPGYLWSWRNAQLHWDLFQRKTEQRNDAAGRWRTDLAIIGANHVLSMVDAFRTLRLRAQPQANGGVSITGSIPIGGR